MTKHAGEYVGEDCLLERLQERIAVLDSSVVLLDWARGIQSPTVSQCYTMLVACHICDNSCWLAWLVEHAFFLRHSLYPVRFRATKVLGAAADQLHEDNQSPHVCVCSVSHY